ncbi:MAG: hypothetical protein Q7T73_09850 [Beijerinckiaceae bacterium]|nr:hypothetical protein [Beijerinckiaceae bacterium]
MPDIPDDGRRRAGKTVDLTDSEMAQMRASRTPAAHDYELFDGAKLAVRSLLARLRSGWSPKADEIDVPQRDLVDWRWFGVDRLEANYASDDAWTYTTTVTPEPELQHAGSRWSYITRTEVLWFDRHLGWALTEVRFYWLYDAEEGQKLAYLGG